MSFSNNAFERRASLADSFAEREACIQRQIETDLSEPPHIIRMETRCKMASFYRTSRRWPFRVHRDKIMDLDDGTVLPFRYSAGIINADSSSNDGVYLKSFETEDLADSHGDK